MTQTDNIPDNFDDQFWNYLYLKVQGQLDTKSIDILDENSLAPHLAGELANVLLFEILK